ncbi:MAG: hypothetical protein P8M68_00595 [Aquiluna sp.]|nr:hypothetical protein [Aquiluna sp.]
MSDSFVGFARSPKPDPNKTLITRDIEILTQLDLAALLAPFITKDGLNSWLGEVSKFDFQTGAKLKYKVDGEEFGASYSMITLPKRVVLVTESLGEIDIKINHKKASSLVKVGFRLALLPNQVKSFNAEVDRVEQSLSKGLGG